ncbi:MAG TPA: hypothetical protein H9849_06430, partial [Candidatus Anaerobutyricum stercoripullorum]|nr:hypothetical protein [Candidatus Anaerobutyricum stercoripullorum]
MKKRLTAIFLCLCMLLTLLPATAFAAGTQASGDSPITVGGIELDGSAETPAYATTDTEGTVITDGASETNYNVKWDGETLTLRDAVIVTESKNSAAIERQAPFILKLEGRNTVNNTVDVGIMAICNPADDASGNIAPDTLDALTICGDGSLDVTGYMAGIATGGNLIIKSGTVTAKVTGHSDNMSFGIGTLESGNIYIEGGKVTASGGGSSALSAGLFSMGYEYNGQALGGTIRITGGEVTAVGGEITETGGEESGPISLGSFGIRAIFGNTDNNEDITDISNGTISVSPVEGEAIEIQAGADADTAAAIPGSPFDSGDHDITDAVSDKVYFHSKAFTPVKEEPQVPAEKPSPEAPSTPQPATLTTGATYTAGGNTYRAASANTVVVKTVANKKTVKIPSTVTVNGVKAKVTAIDKNAFKKAKKKLTKVVIG